jgi:hypothetical protein
MRKKLVWLAAFAAFSFFIFKNRTAIADVLSAVSSPIVVPQPDPTLLGVPQLLTDLDPLLGDLAVTDDQLLTVGSDDTLPLMIDDPAMLIVDDDRVQCPNAQFTTINSAVAAALPGQIIRVCPGIYRESVVVNKAGLTLQAPRQQGQATQCQDPSAEDPTKEAIVIYSSGNFGALIGFEVEAPNVLIEGFTIEPNTTLVPPGGGGALGIGIFVGPAVVATDLRHNVLQKNSIGIDVHNPESVAKTPANVRENCVRNNTSIRNGGVGIFSDQGLHHAVIQNNFLLGNGFFAVLLQGGSPSPPAPEPNNTDIQLVHNTTVNDGPIALVNSGNITVDYNKVNNSSSAAIFLGAGVNTGEVSFNNLQGGPAGGNGILLRAEHLGSNAVAPATNLNVKSNKVLGFGMDGIRLSQGANANIVETNRVAFNSRNGMMATQTEGPQPFNNQFNNNHMRSNGLDDCFDDTVGGGTAGTANFWNHDNGVTQNRPGLCKKGSP